MVLVLVVVHKTVNFNSIKLIWVPVNNGIKSTYKYRTIFDYIRKNIL